MVPRAVLMKSGLVSINTARQVNVAHSKTTVNAARPMSYLSKIAHSTVKRSIHKNTTFKNNNIDQRVNTVSGKKFNTARPKAVVNAVKRNSFNTDQGVIDSGCSRHMTWNMFYLIDYEEIDGGYVAFGGNPKRGKIIRKCFSSRVTPLFPTMVVQNQAELGKGLAILTDPHHTPTIIQPSTQPQKTQKPRKPKSKDTQVPQPSDPSDNVIDEAVHKEMGDSLVRAATTASSLETEQDSGGSRSLKRKEFKTHKLMMLYKVGLSTRIESSGDEESLGKDASKQERINAIDAYNDITLVSVQNVDEEMFDVDALNGEEVFVIGQNENVFEEIVDAAQVSTATTIDKGKGIMIEEPVKPMKKKDLIRLDKEVALKLQDKFDEEERLAREKAEKEKEANIALIEEWDDIQAKIDVDYQLAERLKAQEQEELSVEEKAKLFQQLLEQRRKHFAAKRAEEERKTNTPITAHKER
ncbi:hypothetical protein Tco_1328281 [Tanacetum coccineum]